MPIYNAPLLELDLQEIKRYAGLSKASFDEEQLKKASIDTQILSHVQGSWEIYDYQAEQGEISSQPIYYIEGKKIRNHLQGAQKIIVLSVTLGEEIETAITAHFKVGNYTHSLLVDAAATTAVETAADAMEKTIHQNIAPLGYQMTTRFSPGYGDWDIHFQPQMLALASAGKIGIKLTESYMLLPRKSITAMIGLIPQPKVPSDVDKKKCSNCDKLDCLARRESDL